MTDEMLCQLQDYALHFAGLYATQCRVVNCVQRRFEGPVFGAQGYFGDVCKRPECSIYGTYAYGCAEAYRWGGKYIYYCHAGFVFVAASVSDAEGKLWGGLVLGPVVMGSGEDMAQEFSDRENLPSLKRVANLSTAQVGHVAELMAAVTAYVSGVPHSLYGSVAFRHEDLLQSFYKNAECEGTPKYPIETEKKLRECILDGNRSGAGRVLNDLLARIFLSVQFDLQLSRERIAQLLAVISRAAIDAGAQSDEVLWLNEGYMKELQTCQDIDQLSVWVAEVLHRYVDSAFDYSAVKHSDTVYKVMQYIQQNYRSKIVLEDIARHVNFSKTYLSRIYKQETGENISAAINRARIDRARQLLGEHGANLVDVANLVGFEDQSYFTKVFKSIVGMPPKKYQELHARHN